MGSPAGEIRQSPPRCTDLHTFPKELNLAPEGDENGPKTAENSQAMSSFESGNFLQITFWRALSSSSG